LEVDLAVLSVLFSADEYVTARTQNRAVRERGAV
jgi:hypothetical protein